ncbi:hypothetical protein C6Y40_18710 [Alteromonas alba]|uniref:Uncharacterized protein n=1 Tax=Alteromonas alba TaxID=2079529 RepID=A0A2S9V669_9ALTE|nr:hypothetical protein C6Y40_18710 [Alteromonas alba]
MIDYATHYKKTLWQNQVVLAMIQGDSAGILNGLSQLTCSADTDSDPVCRKPLASIRYLLICHGAVKTIIEKYY